MMKGRSHTSQAAAHLNSDNVRTVDEILVPFSTNPESGSCLIPDLEHTWNLISAPT